MARWSSDLPSSFIALTISTLRHSYAIFPSLSLPLSSSFSISLFLYLSPSSSSLLARLHRASSSLLYSFTVSRLSSRPPLFHFPLFLSRTAAPSSAAERRQHCVFHSRSHVLSLSLRYPLALAFLPLSLPSSGGSARCSLGRSVGLSVSLFPPYALRFLLQQTSGPQCMAATTWSNEARAERPGNGQNTRAHGHVDSSLRSSLASPRRFLVVGASSLSLDAASLLIVCRAAPAAHVLRCDFTSSRSRKRPLIYAEHACAQVLCTCRRELRARTCELI